MKDIVFQVGKDQLRMPEIDALFTFKSKNERKLTRELEERNLHYHDAASRFNHAQPPSSNEDDPMRMVE